MQYLSTLGYTPNILIQKYQLSFLNKLQKLWKDEIGGEVPPDDFLLYPDYHGLLLIWIRDANDNHTQWKEKILEELQKYQARWNSFSKNNNEVIPWTDICITLDYINLDVDKHTHPDHKKNNIGITFWSKSPQEWLTLFAESFSIVQAVSPGFMSEINLMIRKILPFDVSYGAHNSWSYSSLIGHLLMSYPAGMDNPEIALLEAILHEYNHNKLNLILQTETLILSDKSEIYYSPYRPDARHILGIYLGLHALAWAYWVILHAHLNGIITLSEIWKEKAALYVFKNWLSIQVLEKYGKFSPLWDEILKEMIQVHKECLTFIKDGNFSKELLARAKVRLVDHFNDVKKNYPNLRS